MSRSNIKIKNKKARFLYELSERNIAGIQLLGTEIKSLRHGKASLTDAYCFFRKGELFVKMHIAEYSHGGYVNHEPKRDRKLLLTARELKKLNDKVQTKGFTIVPTFLFINEKGLAKLEVALAKGKKQHDKRASDKTRDWQREKARILKSS